MSLQAPWLTETIIRLAADPGDFERWVAARDAEMDGCSVGYRAWRQKVKKKKEERRQDKLLFGDILNRRKDGVAFEDEACDGANGAGGLSGGAEQAWTAAGDVSGNRSVEVEVGGQRTRIDVGVRDSTSSDDSGWEGLGLDSNATSDDSSEVLRQITSLKHGDDEQLALLEIEAQKRRQYRQWKLRKKQRSATKQPRDISEALDQMGWPGLPVRCDEYAETQLPITPLWHDTTWHQNPDVMRENFPNYSFEPRAGVRPVLRTAAGNDGILGVKAAPRGAVSEGAPVFEDAISAYLQHDARPPVDEDVTAPPIEGPRVIEHSRVGQPQKRLWIAASEGHVSQIDELLRQGASVNLADWEGISALHRAAARGHIEAVGALLRRGAEMEARTSWNGTALHCAADWGRAEVAGMLLRAGANLEAVDVNGQTALHLAVQLPCRPTGPDDDVLLGGGDGLATVRVLVAAGARSFVRDITGNTPRDYCSEYHPHNLRSEYRSLLPPMQKDEAAYYARRGPPAGITVELGPEGAPPEWSSQAPRSWGDSVCPSYFSQARRLVPPAAWTPTT